MWRFHSRWVGFVIPLGGLVLYAASSSLSDPPDHTRRAPPRVHGSVFSPGFSLRHSSTDSILFTLSLSDLRIQRRSIRGPSDLVLTLSDGERLGVVGAPDLPVYRKLVAIPDGGAVSVTTRVRSQEFFDDTNISDYRPSAGESAYRIRSSLSRGHGRGLYPRDIATVDYVGHMRGQRIASILVSPARYDRSKRELVVATDCEVCVRVEDPTGDVIKNIGPLQGALTGAALNCSGLFSAMPVQALGASVSASYVSGQVCWTTGNNWQDAAYSAASCGADYLMIVDDGLLETSTEFVDSLALRRADYNGFNVAIVKMSQIAAAPDTADTPDDIRALVDSVYSSATAAHMGDGRLGYVLLVGDAYDSDRSVLIPSYYGYGLPESSTCQAKKLDFFAASDAYYSFLAADPAEDRFPDVLIGRLPIDHDDNDWELTNMVRKILRYEPLSTSAWADSVLMVSGGSDVGFGQNGGAGFATIFDSVLTYHPPPGKSVSQLHRIPYGSVHTSVDTVFGNKVAGSIDAGKWLTAYLDHGFLFYWDGTFFPVNYEFLGNAAKSTIVLSVGSHTCEFDLTADAGECVYSACVDVGGGCMVPSPSSPACESPGYALVDACDVMAERLLVQPNGAVAVVGYSRTTATDDATRDFYAFFRALAEQTPTTLGELLVATRLFHFSSDVTVRNLMLLGDPALDIRTRATTSADTVDLAIGAQDISANAEGDHGATYYIDSNSTLTIDATVRNTWRTNAYGVEVEFWWGDPTSGGSSLLATDTLATIPAHGDTTVSENFGGLSGNVGIYVVVDPSDDLVERNEDNNVASRHFLVLPYEGDFPVRLPSFAASGSVVVSDLTSDGGREFLVGGISATGSSELRCYALGDTTQQWANVTTGGAERPLSVPVVGYLSKSERPFVLYETWRPGVSSLIHLLSGQSGSEVSARSIGQTNFTAFGFAPSALAALADLGGDDEEMEFVSLVYRPSNPDSLLLQAFSGGGAMLFSTLVHVSPNSSPNPRATMGVADLDLDGTKELVVVMADANIDELRVYSYDSGGNTLAWSHDIADGTAEATPHLVLVDVDGEGSVEILCSGTASSDPIVRLYDAGGSEVWSGDIVANADPRFSAGDIDGDGEAEVVVADEERLRVFSGADGQLLDTCATIGQPVTTPYLVDLDDDGKLDIVILYATEQIPVSGIELPGYANYTYLYVLDESLDPLEDVRVFPTHSGFGGAEPAIDDLDGDGKYEMIYVSRDNVLHVFEIGTAAGDAAWSQANANELHSHLNEQPIVGTYDNPVSLYQRSRMLGDVDIDSSLHIGPGTTVYVDTSTTDPYQLSANGSVRIKGSSRAPVTFQPTYPAGVATWGGLSIDDPTASSSDPDSLIHVHLTDATTGIEAHSPLFVKKAVIQDCESEGMRFASADSVVVDSSTVSGCDHGIVADSSTTLLLSNSSIDDCPTDGVLVRSGSVLYATGVTFNGNYDGLYLTRDTGSWVKGTVASCIFTDNDHDGVYVDDTGDSSVVVTGCTFDGNATNGVFVDDAPFSVLSSTLTSNTVGVFCNDYSYGVVEWCTITSNTKGVNITHLAEADLGHTSGGDSEGYNVLGQNSSYFVFNGSAGTTMAENNYWNGYNQDSTSCGPKASKIYGSVDSNPALCTPPSLGPESMLAGAPEENRRTPSRFALRQNYPNPFNPTTTIAYDVPPPGARVEISLYDVGGGLVATLVDEAKRPGFYSVTWDAHNRRGRPVASGVYFLRMRAGTFVQTKKLLMLK